MSLSNKNKNKAMSNFKGNNSEGDIFSTGCIGHEIFNFQEERRQFPLPCANHDPFNLFTSPQKYEDISIYLSLNQEKDIEMSFLMNVQDQICQGCTQEKSLKEWKHPEKQNSQEMDESKQESVGETKNIPKNFGKQLIKFVKKNSNLIEKILKEIGSNIKYQDFNTQLQKRKKKMNKIGDLKQLWLDKTKFGREMRIISCHFLRKYAYAWIFNSRVQSYRYHLKYRSILTKFIKKPDKFVFLKTDY